MAEKILVVDDDLDTLRLVGLMLQRQGYEIIAANHGSQALAMAQSEQPDLVLLDVMMPELDGVEVTRSLRANEITKNIPIILFTAKTQVDDKIIGFEAGADDYLTKPTQPRELFAHVKAVLARSNKSKIPAGPPAERGFSVGVLAVRGGLGVTTLALNLGVSLYEATKKSTIVAEFRPGQGTLGPELGFLRPEGLNRLLHCKPTEISPGGIETELTPHASGIRLLLSSPRPKDAQYSSLTGSFEAIARHIVHMARYIIFDLGTSLTPLIDKTISYCDEVIVVVEPVSQTLAQTRLLIEDLVAKGIGEGRINTVLVNRVRSDLQLSRSQAQEQLGRNISVVFTPAPELAYQSTSHNLPMVIQQPDSLTTQQFARLAEKITLRNR